MRDGFSFSSSEETQQLILKLGFRRIEHDFSDLNDLLNSLMPVKPVSVQFVTCPKHGLEMEAAVLHRVGFLAYFCPEQGQDFKPSAAPLYPNMGQVLTPPPPKEGLLQFVLFTFRRYNVLYVNESCSAP